MVPVRRGLWCIAWMAAGAAAAAACGGGGPSDWEEAAPLFQPDRVLEIAIDMAPADWDALRTQTRTEQDLLGRPDCLGSRSQPVHLFPGHRHGRRRG
jgi:hypothetical protein